jgi:hypothetical protein
MFAVAIGTTAGGTVLAGAGLSGDTTVPIKEAIGVASTALLFMYWLDHKFEQLKSMSKKNRYRSDQRMLWARAMFQTICRKLKIDMLPMPTEDEPSSTK